MAVACLGFVWLSEVLWRRRCDGADSLQRLGFVGDNSFPPNSIFYFMFFFFVVALLAWLMRILAKASNFGNGG